MSNRDERSGMNQQRIYTKKVYKQLPSGGIKSWIDGIRSNENPTILNLLKDVPFKNDIYKKFTDFFDLTIKKVSDELDNNKGPIIECHLPEYNKEYLDNMSKIVDTYKEFYLNSITNDGNHELTDKTDTSEQEVYPNYKTDLYGQKDKPYTYFETKIGLTTPIVDQDDKEFLHTLDLRVNGLKQCLDAHEGQNHNMAYFQESYDKEKYNLDFPKLSKYKETDSDIIKSQCKLFRLGNSRKELTTNNNVATFKKEFKEFMEKDNYKETILLKTVLPKEYFIKLDNNTDKLILNYNKIYDDIIFPLPENKEQAKLLLQKYRQYVFGYYTDDGLKIIRESIRPFLLDAGGTLRTDISDKICSPFVNWTIMLNLLYCNCAISNDDILCPVRFIIPFDDTSTITIKDSTTGNIKEFSIREKKKIVDLFHNNTDKFIGIITIKYVYDDEQTNTYRKGKKVKQFRIWVLFIFENTRDATANQKSGDLRRDSITGTYDRYFIVNTDLKLVNKGSLYEKHNITHNEFTFFVEKLQSDKITFYMIDPTIDKKQNIVFISKRKDLDTDTDIFLKDLKFRKVNIKIINNFITKFKPSTFEIEYKLKGGSNNNKNFTLKLQTHKNETILLKSYTNISGHNFNEFINNTNIFFNITKKSCVNKTYIELYNISKYLYNYLLISYNHIFFTQNVNSNNNKKNITKYIPISNSFYALNELFINYNIFNLLNKNIYDKNSNNILCFGNNLSIIELLQFNNYKIKNITNILISSSIIFNKNINNFNEVLMKLSKIYNIKSLLFDNAINKLIFYKNDNIYDKNMLVYYDNLIVNIGINKYDNYFNIGNLLIGILIGLKYTAINGIFIIYLGTIAYKNIADLYIIASKYFKHSHLYYPEISNLFKNNGVYAIFTEFIGIPIDDYDNILNMVNKVNNILPNDGKDFNIYNQTIRDNNCLIYKPIDKNLVNNKYLYIAGFLNNNINDPLYDEIRKFNEEQYFIKNNYMIKLLIYLNKSITELESLKIPTKEQIVSSILYCRKYDIPIFDKYSITSQNNTITKTILHDLYGLHEPLNNKFKTPFSTHIANKIIFNPKFKSISRTNSTFKQYTSLLKTETISISKSKSKSKLKSHSLFNNLFSNSTIHKSSKHKSSKHKSSTNKLKSTKKQSQFKHSNISLEDAIFNSNNQLIQVGRLIDVRKDFTKANPTELYDKIKHQLRFYKGTKGDGKNKPSENDRNVGNLDIKVQKYLGDFSISQAWLKMYEIITDCNLIPTNRKGIYKSFHICEAPGTFINCINNYIHTKTNYDSFEWISQSLKPKGARSKADTISDTYGLIKRHHEKWDWGVDGTGDITNIDNIKHYAKIAKNMNINLMTSDCGLPWGDPKYYQVAYASYVSLLYSLPHNGTLLYKILSPIDIPLIWNLIYITYTNFKEMYFFKPVQNSQSREFYIIGKGYLGTDQKVLDKLLYLVQDFEDPKFNKEEYDLFNDIYPEEFVIQVQTICDKLASNYVNSIERIIYYVDNIDALGKDYQKHIESYMEEKNDDWVRKYKPKRLEKKFIL